MTTDPASSTAAGDYRPIEEIIGWKRNPKTPVNSGIAWILPDQSFGGATRVDDLLVWLRSQNLNAHIHSEVSTSFVECEITDHSGNDWGIFNGDTALGALTEAVREVANDAR